MSLNRIKINESTVVNTGIVYDISKATGQTYETLADALGTDGKNVPPEVREGGMSVRFVLTDANKYMQYRLTAELFNTDTAQWLGVDARPIVGSNNLVESGGTFEKVQAVYAFITPATIQTLKNVGYYVNDGVYTPYGSQTSEVVYVFKGTRLNIIYGKQTTLRYGLYEDIPAEGDKASFYGSFSGSSNNIIEVPNSGYLVLSHLTFEPIEIIGGDIYNNLDRINDALCWSGLSMSYIKEVNVSGNLFKIAKKISDDGKYISNINSDGTLYFTLSASTGYRSYLIPVDSVSTYNFTFGRFVVLMKDEIHVVDGTTLQQNQYSVSSIGAKYIAFCFNSEIYPESTYQVGIGDFQAEPVFKIPYLKVSTDNLEDNAVTLDKTDLFVLSKNLFNINDSYNVIGKYISLNTFKDGDGSYNTTGYIPVNPNTTYQCSNDGEIRVGVYLARFVCQYGSDKSYISGADLQPSSDNNRFTTGDNTYFIRVSAKGVYWDKYQIEEGSAPTAWEPYKHIIDPQYLPEEFSNYESFGHFEGSATLAQNETLTLSQSYSRKNLDFSALIEGTDNANLDVLIGLGYNKFRGAWLELTPTKVIVHEYTTGDSITEYTHGLTLGSTAVVSFDAGTTDATIKVISDGNVFSQSIDRGFFFGGAGFVTNKGSNSIDAKLSVMLKDVTKKVWLFGDSYLSWNDTARWPYWILQWGFKSWMSDSLPGGNSAVGYTSFINDNKIGKPVYLLWANGMNDTADVDVNTPDFTWLNYVNNVISRCENEGITPILATIPSVPSKLHDGKNKWIRESGYRYIDFATAVDANSSGVWKAGMLAGDNVHPTQLGAKALAAQVLIDFPEIMVE